MGVTKYSMASLHFFFRSAVAEESVMAIRTVCAFGGEQNAISRFEKELGRAKMGGVRSLVLWKKWWTSWWFQIHPSENSHGTWKYPNPGKGWKRRNIHKTTVFLDSMSTFQGVFLFSPPKIGAMIQFHGCLLQMGWVATTNKSEDPAGDPYENFGPTFFQRSID